MNPQQLCGLCELCGETIESGVPATGRRQLGAGRWQSLAVILFLAVGSTAPLRAQEAITVGSELDAYLRLLELTGTVSGTPLVFRSFTPSYTLASDTGHWWSGRYPLTHPAVRGITVRPLAAEMRLVYNSKYPHDVNDGALWAGKGGSAALSAGVQVKWGPVTGTLYPTVYASQNDDFPLAPVSFGNRPSFAYAWHQNIDWPQRFGAETVKEYDWGQSGIRVDLSGFTAGFSTENMWWGPTVRNPIIMGNSAAGFPHIDLGTGRPVWIGIGHIEARAIWGELRESDYFDTDPDNDRRYITGLTFGYRPSFLPGLTIGGTRVLYQRWPDDGLGAGEIFDFFGEFFNEGVEPLPGGGVGNDPTDQLLSVVARWVLPDAGIDVYLEWARNDFSGNLRDFLLEPDHSRGFTVGFQKTLASHNGVFRLRSEFTTLGLSATAQIRANPTFYVHSVVHQGYTQRGQLLGAGIGPGANSQVLGVDRYSAAGRWGVSLQRVRFDDDAFFRDGLSRLEHDVELTLGGSVFRFVGPVEVGGGLELSRRLNWYRVEENDVTNLNAKVVVRWSGITNWLLGGGR